MRKIIIKTTLISILLLVMLSGCAANNQDFVPEASPTAEEPLATATSTPTVAPSLMPTITHTPTPEFRLMDEQLPDLLLSVNRASRYQCNTQGSEETWLASYPYTSPKPLLVSSEVDYRFPTWSPDGEWIAYVESKPEIVIPEEGANISNNVSGSDTLWIIRPDGSEKRQIGEPVPSGLFAGFMGENIVCDVITEMASIIAWSPDGQYIIYVHSQIGGLWYYLAEVSTGKTVQLLIQQTWAEVYWVPQTNQVMFLGDSETINRIDIQDIANITKESIPLSLPDEVKTNNEYELTPFTNSESLYGIFIFRDPNFWEKTNDRVMVWRFSLPTRQWEKIIEVPFEDWNHPQFIDGQIFTYNREWKQLQLLDPQDWEQIGKIYLPKNFSLQWCLKAITDASGKTWIVCKGTQAETQTGLWAILLRPDDEAVPQLIFDFASIPGNLNELSSIAFRQGR